MLHLILSLSLAGAKDLVLHMMHLGSHSDSTDCPSRMNVVKKLIFYQFVKKLIFCPVMKQEAKFQAIALYDQI